jgi:drug/metabolite transporter (DMT)-like permease|tara:strand:- start:45 stop:932 length:888 start_codon:yes stop_codon:yes gene_type:complete
MSKNFKAIMLALIASFCAVLMSVFLKLAQEDSNVFTVGFLRFFFGLLLITPIIIQSNFKIYNTINFKLHILRCIINVPMMIFGFAALTYIPLEQIKAIGFLSPILVVILSVIFLGERIYLIRTFSLILGFIGTLIILRPGFIEINIGVYMVLASALLWSCVIIITKFMSKNDSAMTILTFQYTFVTLFTLPLAIIYWNNPSFISLIYTLLAAIVGTVLHLCINNAYKLSDLSIIQPVWFTQLVFASFLGFIIFGSLPDFFTWIGAILVFISVLIITYRENYLKKDIAKTSIPLKN